LKNFIEKLVALAKDPNSQISIEAIQELAPEQEIEFIEEQSFLMFKSLEDATRTFQRRYIVHLLKKNNFDLDQVADKLGLSVDDLKSKLSELDINFKSDNNF
jgi:DNA-binding NtrC family response regulator